MMWLQSNPWAPLVSIIASQVIVKSTTVIFHTHTQILTGLELNPNDFSTTTVSAALVYYLFFCFFFFSFVVSDVHH